MPADPWTGADKTQHFLISAYVASTFSASGCDTGPMGTGLPAEGPALALLAGMGKEASDSALGTGVGSWRDMAWNAAGVLVGTVLAKSGIVDPPLGTRCRIALQVGGASGDRLQASPSAMLIYSHPIGALDGRPLRQDEALVVYDSWRATIDGSIEVAARPPRDGFFRSVGIPDQVLRGVEVAERPAVPGFGFGDALAGAASGEGEFEVAEAPVGGW